jgi:alpha-glucosidase
VLAFMRSHGNETLVCLFNFGAAPATYPLPARPAAEALDGHGFSGRLDEDGAVHLDPEEAFFGRLT